MSIMLFGDLQVFNFDGAQVRVVMVSGDPWWVASDVARLLGHRNAPDAVRMLKPDQRGTHAVRTPGGTQQATVMSESGLYRLIMRSNRPDAEQFQDWVTETVLPAIRKTGVYQVAQDPAIPQTLSEALRLAADALDRADLAEAEVKALAPAAEAWTAIASASGNYSLRQAAGILNQCPEIKTGQNLLAATIGELGMVDAKREPYAKHSAHLVQRPRTYKHPTKGHDVIAKPQIRVTVLGLDYLRKKLGGTERLAIPAPDDATPSKARPARLYPTTPGQS